MSELLKDMFNYDSLREFALETQLVYDSFAVDKFLDTVIDDTWDELELKARGRKITETLGEFLPSEYEKALGILEKVAPKFSFSFFFPDFIEVYGQNECDWDLSINALERHTQYWSSELAVRSFIIRNEKRMMKQMYAWSKHENEHIRRLSSEGCRPQLPWAQALDKYKKDPTPILPILEELKDDSSLYVRKSVANNLNDISKTNPDLVVELAQSWYGDNEAINWVVKHGCRTLLKKGNREVLAIFGYHDADSINVDDFIIEAPVVAIGSDLVFSFAISTKEVTKVRLEYGIDYVKANGKRNRKIFQISESSMKKNQNKHYSKKHSFEDKSTRKHYPGTHSITLIINGVEQETYDFELSNIK